MSFFSIAQTVIRWPFDEVLDRWDFAKKVLFQEEVTHNDHIILTKPAGNSPKVSFQTHNTEFSWNIFQDEFTKGLCITTDDTAFNVLKILNANPSIDIAVAIQGLLGLPSDKQISLGTFGSPDVTLEHDSTAGELLIRLLNSNNFTLEDTISGQNLLVELFTDPITITASTDYLKFGKPIQLSNDEIINNDIDGVIELVNSGGGSLSIDLDASNISFTPTTAAILINSVLGIAGDLILESTEKIRNDVNGTIQFEGNVLGQTLDFDLDAGNIKITPSTGSLHIGDDLRLEGNNIIRNTGNNLIKLLNSNGTNQLQFNLTTTIPGMQSITTALNLNQNANFDISCFAGAASGERPEFIWNNWGSSALTNIKLNADANDDWNFTLNPGDGGNFTFNIDTDQVIEVPDGYWCHQIVTSNPNGVVTTKRGAMVIFNDSGDHHHMVQVDDDGDGTGDNWDFIVDPQQ